MWKSWESTFQKSSLMLKKTSEKTPFSRAFSINCPKQLISIYSLKNNNNNKNKQTKKQKHARILGKKRRLLALLPTVATMSPNPAQKEMLPRHSLPWKLAISTLQVVDGILGSVQKLISGVIFKQVANTEGNECKDTLLW